MQSRGNWARLVVVAAAGFFVSAAHAQQPGGLFAPPPANPEVAIVEQATNVLNEVMAIPASAIPRSMLADAEGIAIIPGLLKGGFVIGARHGRGVVVTRANGGWTAPVFISMTGGSFGWQAGLQSIDVILVFKTKKSVQNLMNGKFTIGADAAAAAGPVGREASVATDARFRSELYSYSRSRGLFVGVALDGSVISIDGAADNRYYYNGVPPVDPTQPKSLPPSAIKLLETIAKYTAPEAQPTAPGAPQPAVAVADPNGLPQVAAELGAASQSLYRILDPNWQSYLALPADPNADTAAWAKVVTRFETVAANPQYQALTSRPEFQQTYGLLKSYTSLRSTAATLTLPAPPQ